MRARRWLVTGGVLASVVVIVMLLLRRETEPATSSRTTILVGSGSAYARATRAQRTVRPMPPPPAGGLRLEGQVIDERERPIGGATVRFESFDGSTTTAEDGSFVFENLAAHEYRVVAEASADTYCDDVAVELTASSEPVILRVFPGATATVHVIDAETAQPIAGAWLYEQRTDANGDVKLRGLRPGDTYVLFIGVEADGYERTRVKVFDLDLASPSENVFTVEMTRGVTVSGTVVGPNGERVTKGEVSANADRRTRTDADLDATGAWSMTLAAGTFELAASSEGREATQTIEIDKTPRSGIVLRLGAAKPVATVEPVLEGIVLDRKRAVVANATVSFTAGYVDGTTSTDERGRFRATLAAGATTVTARARKGDLGSEEVTGDIIRDRAEIEIVVGPSTIAGSVVDRRGRAAPGVRVSLRAPYDSIGTRTNDRGRFELTGLVPGEHPLVVTPPDQQYSRAQQGTVASTGARDVRLVVEYAGGVTGRVIQDGKPVTYYGAFVEEGDPLLDQPVLVTAPDGRFAIKGIVAGSWRIIVAGPTFGRKVVTGVVVPENDDVDLGDIVVERGRSLRGRVLDASGEGVGGASVVVHERDERTRDSVARAVQGTGVATTDANGGFRIDNLAPSLYRAQRYVIASHPSRGVSNERPLGEHETEVSLVVARAGGIDGRLEGLDKGVLCSRIEDGASALVLGVAPDESGRFHFDDLTPGRYRVRPNGTAAQFAIVTVVSNQRAKAALTVPAERIEVQVRATSCKTVTLGTEDGVDVLDEESCTITDVPPGSYRICADGRCRAVQILPQPKTQAFAIP